MSPWFYWDGFGCDETLLSPNSKDPKLGYRPFAGLRQEKLFQLPLNCEKLKSVSCTSSLLARTCDFRKCTRFRPMLIASLLSHRQNQNLGIIPIYIVVLCFPHDNVVCVHLCEECKKSNVLNACRTLVHFVMARGSLFDHKKSGLPIGAKYKHFRTI